MQYVLYKQLYVQKHAYSKEWSRKASYNTPTVRNHHYMCCSSEAKETANQIKSQ